MDELGLTEEWGVHEGALIVPMRSREAADRRAAGINTRFWKKHENVAGACMASPNAHPVSRLVSEWEANA